MEEIFTESSVTGMVGIICFHTKTTLIRKHAGCHVLLKFGPLLKSMASVITLVTILITVIINSISISSASSVKIC